MQGKSCPARGKLCRACQKPNHFERVCRTKVPGRVRVKTRQRKPNSAVQHIQSGPNTNQSTSESESSEDEILFGVQSFQRSTLKPPKAGVKIGNCTIDVIVDTGACINVLDIPAFNKR